MKVLSVLNPSLKDYKISGAALLGIHLGNYMNKNFENVQVDFIANEEVKNLLDPITRVYTPEYKSRSVISDTIKYAVEVYKSGGYDTMHIHIHQMSVLSAIQQYIPDYIKVVYTQHTSTILGRFSLGYRDSARYLSTERKNIKIIMPSFALKNIWKEYTDLTDSELKNVMVIRNGVVTNEYAPYENTDRLFACGRIDPNKKMLEIAEWCVDYKHPITIVGDFGVGSMKVSDDLKNYYADFMSVCINNKDIINWVRYMSNEDIRNTLLESKACVSFSAKESFALIVAESMSVDTPVFCIEEDAICELLGENYPGIVYRKDLYRKSQKSREKIIEDVYKRFENSIGECSQIVRDRFEELGLSIEMCSKFYYEIY